MPVRASNAAMNPRMPNSPPPTPTITLSFTTSGARVIEYASFTSASVTFQSGRPFLASIATRCASSVPMNSVSPRIATPRLPSALEILQTRKNLRVLRLKKESPDKTYGFDTYAVAYWLKRRGVTSTLSNSRS